MMMDCMIIGDSIAVGIAEVRQDCSSIATVGINSRTFNREHLDDRSMDAPYSTVVISLGTNDWKGLDTEDNLTRLREQVNAERVVWILPNRKAKPEQHDIVLRLAKGFYDGYIEIKEDALGKDGIHPTGKGYRGIAKEF